MLYTIDFFFNPFGTCVTADKVSPFSVAIRVSLSMNFGGNNDLPPMATVGVV